MSEYVLVSQGIVCNRSNNPYSIISEAINSNKKYYEYLERCMKEYETPADNEMFVYKESNGNITEIDLTMCEQLINQAKTEAVSDFTDYVKSNFRIGVNTISEVANNFLREKNYQSSKQATIKHLYDLLKDINVTEIGSHIDNMSDWIDSWKSVVIREINELARN